MKRYISFSKYISESVIDQAIDVGSKILTPNPNIATPSAAASSTPSSPGSSTETVKGTAQNQLNTKYGYPDQNYINTYCENWNVKAEFPWFPASTMLVNKDFKVMLQNAFRQIQEKGLQSEIKTFNGAQNFRDVEGKPGVLSIHCWGAAIDLNAQTEYLGRVGTNWSPEFLQIMRNNGIKWGGDWNGRKDPMHFAMVNG